MADSYPVGKAQQMVLDALGLKASSFQEANAVFESIGIVVASKREGRSSVPQITVNGSVGGDFNAWGEGETWEIETVKVDLSNVSQWIAK